MKSIIIGFGEIGKALFNTLEAVGYDVRCRDVEESIAPEPVDVLHICFPYSKNFVRGVKKYKRMYSPKYTIIHSTVPVGVSKKCDSYYSPVRGIHPHLETSLTTFVKYLAPKSVVLKKYFQNADIPIKEHSSRETLEAMKLYCTTIYGLNIIIEKEIWKFCKERGIDYDTVYTDCNKTYNDGYENMGLSKFKKYELSHSDGGIGGHCIIPNCKILKTDVARFILAQNKKYLSSV